MPSAAARRRRPRSTPAARAVTAPITTVRRVRRAAARHVDRRAAHRQLAQPRPCWPCGQRRAAIGSSSPASATAPTFAIASSSAARTLGLDARQGRRQLVGRTRAAAPGRRRRRRAARSARARAASPFVRTSATIARDASATSAAPGASARSSATARSGPPAARARSSRTQPLHQRRRSPPPSACARPGWRSGARCRRTISSRTTSPFSRSVVPVAVRSTIASTRPVSGASSTEPLTSTISAWRPVAAKYSRGDPRVLRRDPHRRRGGAAPPRPGRRRRRVGERSSGSRRSRGRAARRRSRSRLLDQHVLAGDRRCRRRRPRRRWARRDGRIVTSPTLGEQQLAVVRAHLGRVDADRRRAGRASPSNSAPRGTAIVSLAVTRPSAPRRSSAMCSRSTSSAKPTAGSGRPKRPSRSS